MQRKIDDVLAAVKAPLSHPLFYPRVFALLAKNPVKEKNPSLLKRLSFVLTHDYEELSRRLDRAQIQDSPAVRNVLRTRKLARLLVDEKGEIITDILPELIAFFKEHLYSLGPQRQYDAKRQEHLLVVLQLLSTRKELVRLIKKFTRPLSNKGAEEMIRQTLQLPPSMAVTDAHTRQAVLAAWFCYLRQNVGSCFATAPAEIVQGEQPELFLQDLLDLMAMGRLKRTFGGVEYSVPLSASWGSGDLKKPLLMQVINQEIKPEIWVSPGLLSAFETVGFLSSNETTKQKSQQLKNWIQPLILQRAHPYPFCLVTSEEIIRLVLLQAFGLTEQQVKEYENRPRGLVQSQLLVLTPQTAKNSGGIGERCANFLHLFERAQNAFKALADNALLKAWEFTIASFSETKYEFTQWNLYASLGMGSNEPGGIGQRIYQVIQQKIDQLNQNVQGMQPEYEMLYTQVKTLEARMRHTSTEQELQWLKIEYQARVNEFYFVQEQRESMQDRSQSLVDLYNILYKLYLELFRDYFQEVYDADMQEVTTGPFDDSPAGFRLLYKHGRSNTSQWTRIKNAAEFVDALASFFISTESQIEHALEKQQIEKDISEVVTAIISHVKTKEFIESAFHRMAAAHQVPAINDPLNHLDQIEKKPWAYTSGGTMDTLVNCYYRLDAKPKQEEKWVENEMELLVFLADTLKRLSPRLMDNYLKGKRRSLLMYSPTHAFLLKPTLFPFKETWASDEFTYTSIRDRFVRPAESFIENLLLNQEMIQFLIQRLMQKIPENFRPRFKMIGNQLMGPLNPIFFRDYLVDVLSHDRGLHYGHRPLLATEEIDSTLYSFLPLFPSYGLKDRLQKIFMILPGMMTDRIETIFQIYEKIPLTQGEQTLIGAKQLQDICKTLLCLAEMRTTMAYDYPLYISLAAQKLGFAMPMPLIFADTNWIKEDFGFVVNPGTGKLELWRLDYTGATGYPMTSWKEWLNGSRPDRKWGIYVNPIEYGQN